MMTGGSHSIKAITFLAAEPFPKFRPLHDLAAVLLQSGRTHHRIPARSPKKEWVTPG
jgi:hypothetical protein